ncbi:hypothetical protein HOY82DRAFT_616774 [Tuber indicum]|nr:hypothetical protein HOY82DRAFT_616774 [Tuber indicum]
MESESNDNSASTQDTINQNSQCSSSSSNPNTLCMRAYRARVREAQIANRQVQARIPSVNALRVGKFRESLANRRNVDSFESSSASLLVPPTLLSEQASNTEASSSRREENPIATVICQEELQMDYKSWPRRRMFGIKPCLRPSQILQAAFKAMAKVFSNTKSNVKRRPTGVYFTWHSQLAQKVADGRGWGERVRNQILGHEVKWVTKRMIPEPTQGRHQKILSRLEDGDTLLAVRQYILKAGDNLTSRGLANSITQYWRESADLDDQAISNRSVHSVASVVEKTIASTTAAAWLHKLRFKCKEYRKGIYNDGHERDDVK